MISPPSMLLAECLLHFTPSSCEHSFYERDVKSNIQVFLRYSLSCSIISMSKIVLNVWKALAIGCSCPAGYSHVRLIMSRTYKSSKPKLSLPPYKHTFVPIFAASQRCHASSPKALQFEGSLVRRFYCFT